MLDGRMTPQSIYFSSIFHRSERRPQPFAFDKLLSERYRDKASSFARVTLPSWASNVSTKARALCITQRGLAAVQVEHGGAQSEAEVSRDSEQCRERMTRGLSRRARGFDIQ